MSDHDDGSPEPKGKPEALKPLWYFEVESAHIKWKDDQEKEEHADRSIGAHQTSEAASAHRQASNHPGEEIRTTTSKLEADLSHSRHRINEGSHRVVNYLGEMQHVLAAQDRFRMGLGMEHVRRRYGNQHGRQLASEWISRNPSAESDDAQSTSANGLNSLGEVRRSKKTKNLFVNVSVGDVDPLLSYSSYHTELLRIQSGQQLFDSNRIREKVNAKMRKVPGFPVPNLEPLGVSKMKRRSQPWIEDVGGASKRKLRDLKEAVSMVKTVAKLSGGRGIPGQTTAVESPKTSNLLLKYHPEMSSPMAAMRGFMQAEKDRAAQANAAAFPK